MEKKEKDSGMKILGPLIVLILVALIAFVLLVKFDVAGLGTKVIGPKIEKVPVLNLILPKMPEETIEVVDTTGYVFETVDQAVQRLKATEILLKEKEKEAEKLYEDINLLNTEIERLKIFELGQVQFEQDKDELDQLIANNADPEAFMAYVEKVYPDNALKVYESLVQEKQYSQEIINLTNMYQDMKPANAAAILEETAQSNVEMVSQMLLKLEPSQAGNILAAMDPTVANKISKYMFPDTP